VPRSPLDHRTRAGRAYTAHVRALQAQHGDLPAYARPTLKAAALVAVDLDRLSGELDVALMRSRRRDVNRIRRQMVILRTQLVTLERRLEEIVTRSPKPAAPFNPFAGLEHRS
jgi:hypothetical protein